MAKQGKTKAMCLVKTIPCYTVLLATSINFCLQFEFLDPDLTHTVERYSTAGSIRCVILLKYQIFSKLLTSNDN